MTDRFATLENRLNTAVFSHLSNAQAVLDGVSVHGIFDNAFALGAVGIGMAGTQPAFTLSTAHIIGDPVGKTLVVGTDNYVVTAHEPDGTGVSRLLLEVAA